VSYLTTHVLDTAAGRPALGVTIDLLRISPDGTTEPIAHAVTNSAGRTNRPLLSATAMIAGRYQLSFHIGAYFRGTLGTEMELPFLDIVPVRFSIADPQAHYHIPLLVSPWSYTVYRGG
jgi:5-hydroxyisourate hydrolase